MFAMQALKFPSVDYEQGSFFMHIDNEACVRVSIDTRMGQIVAELYPGRAPLTVGNFLRYVDEGRYDGAMFYRATRPDNCATKNPIRVIQGGLGPQYEDAPLLPPVAHEPTNLTGLSHLDGTLSAARWEPGTAASEFFIVLGDTPILDYGGVLTPDLQGFAAFGRVIDGMQTVERINLSRTGTAHAISYMRNQSIVPPIVIQVRRL
jgi:peptidyl-prolyl cis-trans isomerase A (cyclophilin A)